MLSLNIYLWTVYLRTIIPWSCTRKMLLNVDTSGWVWLIFRDFCEACNSRTDHFLLTSEGVDDVACFYRNQIRLCPSLRTSTTRQLLLRKICNIATLHFCTLIFCKNFIRNINSREFSCLQIRKLNIKSLYFKGHLLTRFEYIRASKNILLPYTFDI